MLALTGSSLVANGSSGVVQLTGLIPGQFLTLKLVCVCECLCSDLWADRRDRRD